ncbi:hypothetical protein CR513_56300, partial [Mucuna pruriens]
DILELHDYTSISMLLRQAFKEESKTLSLAPIGRDKSSRKGNAPLKGHKEECLGKGHITSQCPNKRAMILKYDSNINSESSQEGILDNDRNSSDEITYEGDLLMVR